MNFSSVLVKITSNKTIIEQEIAEPWTKLEPILSMLPRILQFPILNN